MTTCSVNKEEDICVTAPIAAKSPEECMFEPMSWTAPVTSTGYCIDVGTYQLWSEPSHRGRESRVPQREGQLEGIQCQCPQSQGSIRGLTENQDPETLSGKPVQR